MKTQDSKGNLRRLTRALTAHIGPSKVPGLVALVSHDGETEIQILGARSIGGANVQRDTIFRISSMTKPITAAATMILVDEGKLELDDPVDNFLPELSNRRVLKRIDGNLDDTVPAKHRQTVKDLLTFTMGMGIIFAPPGSYPVQKAMDSLQLGRVFPIRSFLLRLTSGSNASAPFHYSTSTAKNGCRARVPTFSECSYNESQA